MTDDSVEVPAKAQITLDPQAQQPGTGGRRAADRALASSVPDDNHILMRMLRMLLQPHHSWMGVITGPLGAIVICVYVVSKWGVPAILAMQTLILQIHGDQIKLDMSDRDIQRQQVQATGELLTAVQGIAEGQQQITTTVREQGAQLASLASSVAAMQQSQRTLAAQQAQLREQVTQTQAPQRR